MKEEKHEFLALVGNSPARLAVEQPQSDTHAALAELQNVLPLASLPVPEHFLCLLYNAACQDNGGGQAARNFLFWLVGQPDPKGHVGSGGIELRRLDRELKNAAFEVLRWWAGPTASDRPLYDVIGKLRMRFSLARKPK